MKKFATGLASFMVLAGVATVIANSADFMAPQLRAAEKAACGITASVTEGPYYVSGTAALVTNNLNTTNLPGTPIVISGHVYEGLDNSKPMANAKIELWHTDDAGQYHPAGHGDVSNYPAGDIALRGFIMTDASGAYTFTSIYPGAYTGRTRHIHVKVTAPTKPTVTTQLIIPILPGDPMNFDDDTVSNGLPRCHLLNFDKTKTPERASFDFRL